MSRRAPQLDFYKPRGYASAEVHATCRPAGLFCRLLLKQRQILRLEAIAAPRVRRLDPHSKRTAEQAFDPRVTPILAAESDFRSLRRALSFGLVALGTSMRACL